MTQKHIAQINNSSSQQKNSISKTSAELLKENKQITSILESINDAFISFDKQFNYVYVNSKAEKLLSKKRKDIIGKNITTAFPISKKHPVFKKMLASIKSNKPLEFDYYSDVANKWLQTKIFPSSEGISIFFSDITDKKHAEEQLQNSEYLYRMVVENVNDLIALIGLDTTILYASPSHKTLLGYNPKQLIGINGLSLVHPDDLQIAQTALKKALTTGRATATFRLKCKDGQWVTLEAVGSVIRIPKGNPYIIMASHDISQRVELEKRKDDFISMASHELKTPVTSLKLFIEVLQNTVKQYDNKELDRVIFRLKEQTDRLKELTSELLDISRIQVGKLRITMDEVLLNQLLEDTIEGLRGTTRRHTLIFENTYPIQIKGDRFRLYQVFTNLITNAIKYSPKGGKILVKLTKEGGKAQIQIRDFGIGIAKNHQARIFDKLYQAQDTTEKTYPGLGMGLYISKELVNRHNGTISVKSKKNKGTTFLISLPIT